MAYTYNLSDDIGKIRLLIPDNKGASVPPDDQPAMYVFEDEEIETFLSLESGLKRSAALALEVIASNEALVLKVIKLLDVTTDGAKVSDALLKRADKLRGQAVDDEEMLLADDGAVVIGMVVDEFTARQAYVGRAYLGDSVWYGYPP
jgi:hypothetical protein